METDLPVRHLMVTYPKQILVMIARVEGSLKYDVCIRLLHPRNEVIHLALRLNKRSHTHRDNTLAL